jgi:hypothetical protein
MVKVHLHRALWTARRVAGEMRRAWLSRGAADSRYSPEQ